MVGFPAMLSARLPMSRVNSTGSCSKFRRFGVVWIGEIFRQIEGPAVEAHLRRQGTMDADGVHNTPPTQVNEHDDSSIGSALCSLGPSAAFVPGSVSSSTSYHISALSMSLSNQSDTCMNRLLGDRPSSCQSHSPWHHAYPNPP